MRNRDTVEFLGVWETLYNPDFKPIEFEGFKNEAGQWRSGNKNKKGNIRDCATMQQLLILANLESYNAILIAQHKNSSDRLLLLREMVVKQIKALMSIEPDLSGLLGDGK